MVSLTLAEVRDRHGGVLPPDAVLRGDDAPASSAPAVRATRYGRAARFAVYNAFIDVTMRSLTGAEVKVWFVLFRDTKATGTARTGQGDIARRAGLSVRAVKLAVKSLADKGLIRVVRRGGMRSGPSVYMVHATGVSVPP